MNTVTFPALNLNFKFSKIAFTLFGLPIYKYSICIVLGIIIALVICRFNKEKFNIDYDFILENTTIGILFGAIGARIYYVLFNLEYYINNPSQIINFRNGGLAIYGGLILGAVSIIVNCKLQKKNILDLFDCIVPYVAIAQCIGRFGNFFNIEAYGSQTTSILRMGINLADKYIEVHPTFLYESIANLIIAITLLFLQRKRKYRGQILLIYMGMYGLIRFFIEGLRIDSLMLFNFRISQILSIIIFIVAIILLIFNHVKNNDTLRKEE